MPDNPVRGRGGLNTGLWRLLIEDWGSGKVMPANPPSYYADENLTHDEAMEKRAVLESELNGKK